MPHAFRAHSLTLKYEQEVVTQSV